MSSQPTSSARTDVREPSENLVLAGLARAVAESPRALPASLQTLLSHLGLVPRSAASRAARRQLAALERAGHVQSERRHGIVVWSLTQSGRQRLALARRSAAPPRLGESPQHRAWAQARSAAAARIEQFDRELQREMLRAGGLLAAAEALSGRGASSDELMLTGRLLAAHWRRLGSAWHCLHEWPEPIEGQPDVDPAPLHADGTPDGETARLRAGRRNISLWQHEP